jgi:deoxyribonuclease V
VILAVDVAYAESGGAMAAGLLLADWHDTAPVREILVPVPQVEDYVPGAFYRRELPCIEAVLAQVAEPLACIVIDGYVTLGTPPRDGLGAVLWDKLGRATPVIGVAKTRFAGAPPETELLRGDSARPLFVTAAGMPLEQARAHIRAMAGAYRLPEMLRRVDGLSRQRAQV